MKFINIYCIENHLIEQINELNEFFCYIEDSLNHAYQYYIIRELKNNNFNDRQKSIISYSKIASAAINGEIIVTNYK